MSPAATAAPPPADAPPATATPLPPPKPYPGLASFQDTPGDRALFFGREKERLELLDLVLSEPLVVVFGRSGLGKTSLLNARLFEDLRQRRFLPVPVRLTHDPDGGPVASLLANVRTAAAAEAWPWKETRGGRTSGTSSTGCASAAETGSSAPSS